MNREGLLFAAVTAAVAVVAVVISFFQWRTAHQKVALDIYAKRYEIYSKLRSIVSSYLTTAAFTNENDIEFIDAQNQARFYFGEEVSEYLERARLDLVQGDFFNRYGDRQNVDPGNHLERNNRLVAFYRDLDRLFIPYMRIDQRMPLWWWSRFRRAMSRLLRF